MMWLLANQKSTNFSQKMFWHWLRQLSGWLRRENGVASTVVLLLPEKTSVCNEHGNHRNCLLYWGHVISAGETLLECNFCWLFSFSSIMTQTFLTSNFGTVDSWGHHLEIRLQVVEKKGENHELERTFRSVVIGSFYTAPAATFIYNSVDKVLS